MSMYEIGISTLSGGQRKDLENLSLPARPTPALAGGRMMMRRQRRTTAMTSSRGVTAPGLLHSLSVAIAQDGHIKPYRRAMIFKRIPLISK